MTGEARMPGEQGQAARASRRRLALSASQLTVLIAMGGILLAVVGVLFWVLRAGLVGQSVDALATAIAGPTPTPTPSGLVPDAVPTPNNLYWPASPQPLAVPNAPGDLLWWDARFAYRRPIVLDAISAGSPAGVWALIVFDGESAQRDGKMRVDGADLRVLAWDGSHWWELPRNAAPRREKRGWMVLFPLQDKEIAKSGGYYLYYGNPGAAPPVQADDAPETSRLLLSLGDEEGVEWGPAVDWTPASTATQTLVSPDGRIVIECPPGGPQGFARVRLRTVPIAEKNSHGPLPDFELHADPPPSPLGPSKIVYWDPPLRVIINWAGLPVSPEDLEVWTHFVYDEGAGVWYSVSVEFDQQRGLIRMVTDQL